MVLPIRRSVIRVDGKVFTVERDREGMCFVFEGGSRVCEIFMCMES